MTASQNPSDKTGDTPHAVASHKKNEEKKGLPTPKRRWIYIVVALGLVYLAYYAYETWVFEETDNAYVTGHLHYISPRISGVVQNVFVEDNEMVQEGKELVKLDPSDYQVQFDEAKANDDKARLDFERINQLAGTKAVSQQDLDHAQSNLGVAHARLEAARLQLQYTTIKAPASGLVGRKNVEAGNRVQPGQALMVIVQNEAWVVANYKETQIAKMKVGQEVEVSVDAIPWKTFKAKVDSFSPASGNQFALLPADNSTGNFTKIVQRLPVKIVFDAQSIKGYEEKIRPGLSVITKVRVH